VGPAVQFNVIPLRGLFLVVGMIGLVLAVAFPWFPERNRYTTGVPNSYLQDERTTYPFAVTGAGFAVFSGLCFLSAALVNNHRQPPS
jgi:hypothetical protein